MWGIYESGVTFGSGDEITELNAPDIPLALAGATATGNIDTGAPIQAFALTHPTAYPTQTYFTGTPDPGYVANDETVVILLAASPLLTEADVSAPVAAFGIGNLQVSVVYFAGGVCKMRISQYGVGGFLIDGTLPSPVQDGQWHLFQFSWEVSTGSLWVYQDGMEVAVVTGASFAVTDTEQMQVLANGWSGTPDVDHATWIAAIEVYGSVRTAADLYSEFDGTLALLEPRAAEEPPLPGLPGEAVFNLGPEDYELDGAGPGNFLVTNDPDGDFDFGRREPWDFDPEVHPADPAWTLIPGTDTGATMLIDTDPDLYYGFEGPVCRITASVGLPADTGPDPSEIMASVELGDPFVVEEGKTYYYTDIFIGGFDGPASLALRWSWLDSSDAVIGTPTVVVEETYGPPAAGGEYPYHLGAAPTGAVGVKVERLLVPARPGSSPSDPGGWVVFHTPALFAETASGYYDMQDAAGWYGSLTPLSWGRTLLTVDDRESIAHESAPQEATSSLGLGGPMGSRTQQTVVAAWLVDDTVNWGIQYDMYPWLGGSGANLYDGVASVDVPLAAPMIDSGQGVGGVRLVCVTMTVDQVTQMVRYYDLDGSLILEYSFAAMGADDSHTGAVYLLLGGWGLIRATVWDRILDEAERAEAVAYVATLVSHDISWSVPATGGSPITGFVLSLLAGKVTEVKVPITTTTYTVPGHVSAVWVQAENKLGRSTPDELVF